MDFQELNLANLGGGVAVEKFQDELHRVVENIQDPNTEATAKRRITLTVTFKPHKERGHGKVELSCESKLAPSLAYETQAFMGIDRRTGAVVACENNPRQMEMEFQQESQGDAGNVAPIGERKVEAK